MRPVVVCVCSFLLPLAAAAGAEKLKPGQKKVDRSKDDLPPDLVRLREKLYSSVKDLDVGLPMQRFELEQGAKLVDQGNRWIKRFDVMLESWYYHRFKAEQRVNKLSF
eukprot:Hpha_TRINITY_DN16357_c1_g4::TRINITY_DN16357_c1_g4_i1::g.59439::m.59439